MQNEPAASSADGPAASFTTFPTRRRPMFLCGAGARGRFSGRVRGQVGLYLRQGLADQGRPLRRVLRPLLEARCGVLPAAGAGFGGELREISAPSSRVLRATHSASSSASYLPTSMLSAV